ncbi:MAG: hypothetical protein K8F91_00345, partial [Candidatus Obscuribacterales bacterium]|nr:hypothetical protein [Candidatus Obscuribacterales bacterium]
MNSTEAVKEIAFSLGFQNVAIGSMDRLVCEFEHYRGWLERGYAASMEYLKCDPQRRADPAFRYPASRSAIIVSVSYYTERAEKPAPFYGYVARYAVGLD